MELSKIPLMTALQQAISLFNGGPGYGDALGELITDGGSVVITPQIQLWGFVCRMTDVLDCIDYGRPVTRALIDYTGDCWFVWLAAGDLSLIPSVTPFPTKHVAFARRGVVRIWRFEETMRLISAFTQNTTTIMGKKGKGKGGKKGC